MKYLWIVLLLLASCASQDAFLPGFEKYFSDSYSDGLGILEVTPWNADVKTTREVETSSGLKNVTVLNGYRVIYAYPGFDQPFVKIHAEQSSSANFEADKAVVLEQLYGVGSEVQIPIQEADIAGRKFYVLNAGSFDAGVHAMVLLFVPEDQMIVTIYFLNQEKNPFESENDFLKLQSAFFKNLAESLNKAK